MASFPNIKLKLSENFPYTLHEILFNIYCICQFQVNSFKILADILGKDKVSIHWELNQDVDTYTSEEFVILHNIQAIIWFQVNNDNNHSLNLSL